MTAAVRISMAASELVAVAVVSVAIGLLIGLFVGMAGIWRR
jgi:hypothetical protein